jgi:uncharacterized Zn finger protein
MRISLPVRLRRDAALLQGRLAKGVMDRVCREGDGLFPSPAEIKLSCSCPDWADMCKHVAGALYGVGARLDESPELLFALRGVDENELIAGAGRGLSLSKAAPSAAKVLDDNDVAALFGLDMALGYPHRPNAAQAVQDRKREHAVYQDEDAAGKARQVTTTSRSKPEPTWVTLVRARNRRARRRRDRAA